MLYIHPCRSVGHLTPDCSTGSVSWRKDKPTPASCRRARACRTPIVACSPTGVSWLEISDFPELCEAVDSVRGYQRRGDASGTWACTPVVAPPNVTVGENVAKPLAARG